MTWCVWGGGGARAHVLARLGAVGGGGAVGRGRGLCCSTPTNLPTSINQNHQPTSQLPTTNRRPPQADTGTKMIHVGRNTRSRIVSKGISAGNSRNCYRGLVQVRVRVCFGGGRGRGRGLVSC